MKNNDGIERIKLIMKHFGLSQRKFALKANMSPQTLNTAIKSDGELKLSVIQDILTAFPEISIEWFVMGKGEMLVDSGNVVNTYDFRELMRTIANLNDMIDEQKARIEQLEGSAKKAAG